MATAFFCPTSTERPLFRPEVVMEVIGEANLGYSGILDFRDALQPYLVLRVNLCQPPLHLDLREVRALRVDRFELAAVDLCHRMPGLGR
jgi:hypothetical protein